MLCCCLVATSSDSGNAFSIEAQHSDTLQIRTDEDVTHRMIVLEVLVCDDLLQLLYLRED